MLQRSYGIIVQRSKAISITMLMMAKPKSARHITKQMKSKELEFWIIGKMSIAISNASATILIISCITYFFGSNGMAMYHNNWKKMIYPKMEQISIWREMLVLQRQEEIRKANPIFLMISIIARLEYLNIFFYFCGRLVSEYVLKRSQSIRYMNITQQLNRKSSFYYQYRQLTIQKCQISRQRRVPDSRIAMTKKIMEKVVFRLKLKKMFAQQKAMSWTVAQNAMQTVLSYIFPSLQQILNTPIRKTNKKVPAQMLAILTSLLICVSSVRKIGIT